MDEKAEGKNPPDDTRIACNDHHTTSASAAIPKTEPQSTNCELYRKLKVIFLLAYTFHSKC